MPGQRFGQHGNGAVRKVDAHAARLGLVVKRGAFAQVVRNIRHRDPQAMATARKVLQRYGVIEVTRRLGIDCREGHMPQICAVGEIRRQNGGGHAGRFPRNLDGKLLRNVGAGQRLFHFGARIVRVAQDLQQLHLDGRIH